MGARLRQPKAELEKRTGGYRRFGFDEQAAGAQGGGSIAVQACVRKILDRDANRPTAITTAGLARASTHPGFLW
jgi:hypothetical protein